jgi:Fe-S-cluster-containing hydrogenase component 2
MILFEGKESAGAGLNTCRSDAFISAPMGNNRKFLDRLLKFWPYRFTFAKLSKLPLIGAPLARAGIAEGDQITLIPVNIQLDPSINVPLPYEIVDDFIRKSSMRVILHKCPCREGEGCKDYPVDIGCLMIGEGAREIDPSLGRQVSVAEALVHEKKARDAGLLNLFGRAKFDALWLGVKEHEKLMTICHCCPCCCVVSVLPHMREGFDDMVVRLEGLELKVEDKCTGCMVCLDSCIFSAMEKHDGKVRINDKCKGCGRCREDCPEDAISIHLNNPKFIEACEKRISSVYSG